MKTITFIFLMTLSLLSFGQNEVTDEDMIVSYDITFFTSEDSLLLNNLLKEFNISLENKEYVEYLSDEFYRFRHENSYNYYTVAISLEGKLISKEEKLVLQKYSTSNLFYTFYIEMDGSGNKKIVFNMY